MAFTLRAMPEIVVADSHVKFAESFQFEKIILNYHWIWALLINDFYAE
jgi:hypothetical protein